MDWFATVIGAAFVCGIALLVGLVLRSGGEPGSPRARSGTLLVALAVIVFVGWAGGYTGYRTVQRVEEGHVGIVYQFGEIVGLKGDGLQFVAPWQQFRTVAVGLQRARFEEVGGFTRDRVKVTVTVTVDYHVAREAVLDLYRLVGPNWFDILIEPRVSHYFKEAMSLYKVDEVGSSHEDIGERIEDALTEDMELFGVTIERLLFEGWAVADGANGR